MADTDTGQDLGIEMKFDIVFNKALLSVVKSKYPKIYDANIQAFDEGDDNNKEVDGNGVKNK